MEIGVLRGACLPASNNKPSHAWKTVYARHNENFNLVKNLVKWCITCDSVVTGNFWELFASKLRKVDYYASSCLSVHLLSVCLSA